MTEALDELREALLDFYALHGVAGVAGDDAFVDLCRRNETTPGFNALQEMVCQTQRVLERDVAGQTRRNQVAEALTMFRRVKGDEDWRFIQRELVLRGYAPAWSAAQRAYFDQASERLQSSRDFFLSFTTYNEAAPNFNFINRDHEMLIGVTGLRREQATAENLLADFLYRRLLGAGFDGYFYPRDHDPGEVVDKLKLEATSCFTFVQLLQRSMFRRHPGNYCKIEFSAAAAADDEKVVFVMGEPRQAFITMHDVHLALDGWYQQAIKRAAIVVEPVETVAEVRTMTALIETKLTAALKGAHDRLLGGVPAN